MARKAKSQSGMNPLPSLLRASAWDAANARMRAAGRSKWTRGDYNEAARTQERLIRACYGRKSDQDKNIVYIRFQIAEQMQREGLFDLQSDMTAVHEYIEQALAA